MSGKGTGSPIFFYCPVLRATNFRTRDTEYAYHRITLTGRTRPYRPAKFTCIGSRSTFVSREYKCSCGHVGWSNHADLERDGT